jgi:hypothetical protein
MKNLFYLPALFALTIFCSCQKHQTEAERNAEVERQVQQRLAAEHQTEEQQRLAQREADVAAREKALSENQNTSVATQQAVEQTKPVTRPMQESSDSESTGSYSTFYTKLEPHGVWRETSDYGYVWQPREAEQSRNWRPYTNGRWIYSDAGWTWVSEEPFGWATYHYGRWTRLRNVGWVWVPGSQWAPAWVSWRKSNDYVGWAPLPPEARFDRRSGIHNWADNYYDIGPDQYSFVPTNQFGAQRVEQTVVPVERNVTIVNQTTNVTNITYSNTTVINQGPNYDELRTRTLQPIERLRIERETNFSVEPQSVVRGNVIFMPAPLAARAQAVERPRAVKETIGQVVVDHGWEGITDRRAAEQVRAKMKSEATPPPNAPSKTFVKPTQVAAESSSAAASASAAATSAPLPAATAAPRARATPESTVSVMPPPTSVPTVSPSASTAPNLSVTPVGGPSAAESSPGFGQSGQGKSQRKAERESRKEQNAERQNSSPESSPAQSATPTPPLVSPSVSNSPPADQLRRRDQLQSRAQKFQPRRIVPMNSPTSLSPAPSATDAAIAVPPSESSASPLPSATSAGGLPRKEERKARKLDRQGQPETTGTPSPSPSAVPQ